MNTVTKFYTSDTDQSQNNIIQFPVQSINKTIPKPKTTTTKSYKNNGTVQPIKSIADIERAKEYFHNNPSRYSDTNIRNYTLFVLGINIGRRISDILDLKIEDIIDNKGKIKDSIRLQESKTDKYVTVYLDTNVKSALKEYLSTQENYNTSDYLFKTRQSECMTRTQAWRIISDMGKELELGNLGTHSMRKTFGYQIMQANKNDPYILATVSEMFNHSSEKITRRYIGLDDEVKKDIYMNLNLW